MKNKKLSFRMMLIFIFAIIITGSLLGIIISHNRKVSAAKTEITLSAKQISDTQNIELSWESDKPIDSIKITITHKKSKVYEANISNPVEISRQRIEIPLFYGKFDISATPTKNTFKQKTFYTDVSLSADEYVIAPLSGIDPISYFTLNLKDITKDYTTPTFVWFERGDAWDYTKMPKNISVIPTATFGAISSSNESTKKVGDIYSTTSSWVRELYEINNNSKFHFYFSDYYPAGALYLATANHLSQENYDVMLLSNGNSSIEVFNSAFDNENGISKLNEMTKTYGELKEQIKNRGTYSFKDKNFKIPASSLTAYSMIITKNENNIKWWTNDNITSYSPNNPEITLTLEELQNNDKLLTTSLSSKIPTDEESLSSLKQLYLLFDEAFDAE